ncbi:MAG: GNAT family N-acetyltransferase [Bacteroidia bacterium]
MQIREYKAADRQVCLEVFKSNIPEFFLLHELADFENWLDFKDKAEVAYKSNQSEYYYTVELENQIVACGGFYIPQNSNEARMAWGMVDKILHKKGIGRQFLKFRIEQIRLINPEITIALDTTQFSYPFFEKLGFKVTKIQKDYYAPGFDRYDMVL